MSAIHVACGGVAVNGRAHTSRVTCPPWPESVVAPHAGPKPGPAHQLGHGPDGQPVAGAPEDCRDLEATIPPGRLGTDRPHAREPVLAPDRLGTERPRRPRVRPASRDVKHLTHLREPEAEAEVVVVYKREPYFWPWAKMRIALLGWHSPRGGRRRPAPGPASAARRRSDGRGPRTARPGAHGSRSSTDRASCKARRARRRSCWPASSCGPPARRPGP